MAESKWEGWVPEEKRIHDQIWEARLQKKKRCTSDSSSIQQLEHLDAKDHPFFFTHCSVGVFLSISLQLKQASLGLIILFQINPDQRVSFSLVRSRFQASLIERSPDELSCQSKWSSSELLAMEMEEVKRSRKFLRWLGGWLGIHHKFSSMMSATKSCSENWREGNLSAIETWSIHLSNHREIDCPLPITHLDFLWIMEEKDLILLN